MDRDEAPDGEDNVVSIQPYLSGRSAREGTGRMFVIEEVAPRDEVKTHEFIIIGSPVSVTYYRNRMTLENDLSAQAQARARAIQEAQESDREADAGDLSSLEVALRLELLVKDWDFYGPLKHVYTGDVLVESERKVPLDAEVIKHIPLRIIRPLNQAMIDEELGGNDKSKPKR